MTVGDGRAAPTPRPRVRTGEREPGDGTLRLVRSTAQFLRALPATLALAALTSLGGGCVASPGGSEESLGVVSQAVTTYGDWALYGDGQCVSGARTFYTGKFGVTLSATGVQTTDVGECAYLGACMYWVSPKVQPSSTKWDRHAWGTEMPKLYDLVIYPPTSTNAYGHVASVDHMEGTDPSDFAKLWVMDSNYSVTEKKSPAIHTISRAPYGFYRLKSQVGPFCTPGWTHLNCGDQAGLHDADPSTLYKCSGVTATAVEKCAYGCIKEASGTDDRCAPPPDAGAGADAGGEGGPGADAGSDADDGAASGDDAGPLADAGPADDASDDATGETGSVVDGRTGEPQEAGGCGVPRGREAGASLGALGLLVAGALATRRRRGRTGFRAAERERAELG